MGHDGRSPRGAVLTVENTGEKLTPQLVATLAEPFLRGTERIRTDHAGVGLGLAIVKSITQAHDGTLTLTPRRRRRAPRHGAATGRAALPARPCPTAARGRAARSAHAADEHHLVDEAPAPVLAGLDRARDRVTLRRGVRPRMTVRRGIAAADRATGLAQT